MAKPVALPTLCLVTDSSVKMHAPIEEVVADAVSGGVGMVQVREKNMPTGELYRLAEKLRLVTFGKALLIINDRTDIALAVDADGIHLPSHSLPIRRRQENSVDNGCWWADRCTASKRPVTAEKEGADYLVLGTIYGTASHPGRERRGALSSSQQVKARVQTYPCMLSEESTYPMHGEAMNAGADGIAVIRSILAC